MGESKMNKKLFNTFIALAIICLMPHVLILIYVAWQNIGWPIMIIPVLLMIVYLISDE